MNDDARAKNSFSRINFKTTILKSSLCDYSNAYILVMGTTSINRASP